MRDYCRRLFGGLGRSMLCVSSGCCYGNKREKHQRIADVFSCNCLVNYVHFFLLPSSNTFHLVRPQARASYSSVLISQLIRLSVRGICANFLPSKSLPQRENHREETSEIEEYLWRSAHGISNPIHTQRILPRGCLPQRFLS